MLPPNFLTIPQIQRERHAVTKLVSLTTLLEYLLKTHNPNVVAAEENRDPKVGERVLADKHLFQDFTRVLWALKVRNSFAHITANEFSERDHRNAVDCLIEAVGDLCKQPAIPRELVQAIYRDPDADLHARQEAEARRRQEEQARMERERRAHEEQAQRLRAEQERLEAERRRQAQQEEEARRRHAQREADLARRQAQRVSLVRGLRGFLLLAVLAGAGYLAWPYAKTLIKGDPETASVVRTQAQLALKQVRQRKKQPEYGAIITQADAAWRDAEIEFNKGNYKQAEEKYRQVLSLWDGLNARLAETLSFEELQTEMNALRAAAQKAQAPQKAADLWKQAEELRLQAVNARKSGNLQEAKNFILQARQQYEIAQATALTAPADATPSPDTSAGSGQGTETPTVSPSAKPDAQPRNEPAERPVRPRPPEERIEQQPLGPSSDPEDDGVFEISEKELRRYVTRQVPAVLGTQERAAGVAGPVVVQVYLAPDGRLSKAWVVEGEMRLREAALAALRQWSFRPYHRDRVPTEIKSELTIYVR